MSTPLSNACQSSLNDSDTIPIPLPAKGIRSFSFRGMNIINTCNLSSQKEKQPHQGGAETDAQLPSPTRYCRKIITKLVFISLETLKPVMLLNQEAVNQSAFLLLGLIWGRPGGGCKPGRSRIRVEPGARCRNSAHFSRASLERASATSTTRVVEVSTVNYYY